MNEQINKQTNNVSKKNFNWRSESSLNFQYFHKVFLCLYRFVYPSRNGVDCALERLKKCFVFTSFFAVFHQIFEKQSVTRNTLHWLNQARKKVLCYTRFFLLFLNCKIIIIIKIC